MNTQIGPITEAQAKKLNKKYVESIKKNRLGVDAGFSFDEERNLKKGTLVLTYDEGAGTGDKPTYKVVRITSNKMNAIGEQEIRVSDGKFSWRAGYAIAPINK